jgi:phosphonate transport system substrate-binding protein
MRYIPLARGASCIFLCFHLLFSPVHAKETLNLYIVPYLTAQQLLEKFTPLAQYLTEKTDINIRLMISPTYEQHDQELGEDRIDIAYIGSIPYVKLVDKYGEKPLLARLETAGTPTFRGAIVVHKDSPIQQIEEVVNKRFAFGSQGSTMSHLMQYYVLRESGITLEQLAWHEFLGSHDNVALGVLMGEFDAGAVIEDIVYKYQGKGLRALAWTPEISEHLLLTRSDLPTAHIEALSNALLTITEHPQAPSILTAIRANLTNFVPVLDSDYDGLREIVRKLEQ